MRAISDAECGYLVKFFQLDYLMPLCNVRYHACGGIVSIAGLPNTEPFFVLVIHPLMMRSSKYPKLYLRTSSS